MIGCEVGQGFSEHETGFAGRLGSPFLVFKMVFGTRFMGKIALYGKVGEEEGSCN